MRLASSWIVIVSGSTISREIFSFGSLLPTLQALDAAAEGGHGARALVLVAAGRGGDGQTAAVLLFRRRGTASDAAAPARQPPAAAG